MAAAFPNQGKAAVFFSQTLGKQRRNFPILGNRSDILTGGNVAQLYNSATLPLFLL